MNVIRWAFYHLKMEFSFSLSYILSTYNAMPHRISIFNIIINPSCKIFTLSSQKVCVLLSAEDRFKLRLNYILDLCPKSKKNASVLHIAGYDLVKFAWYFQACHHESVSNRRLRGFNMLSSFFLNIIWRDWKSEQHFLH